MTLTIEERILEILKPGVGVMKYPVKKVSFLTKWNGYDVYGFHLDVDVNMPIQIGMPRFFLVKNDEIIWSTIEEGIEILAKIYDETYGPDEDDDWEDEDESESIQEPVHCMISCAGPRI